MSFSGWCCQYCTGVDEVASLGGRNVIGSHHSPAWNDNQSHVRTQSRITRDYKTGHDIEACRRVIPSLTRLVGLMNVCKFIMQELSWPNMNMPSKGHASENIQEEIKLGWITPGSLAQFKIICCCSPLFHPVSFYLLKQRKYPNPICILLKCLRITIKLVLWSFILC